MGGSGSSNSTFRFSAPNLGDNPYTQKLADYAGSMWNMTEAPRQYITQDWEKFWNPAQGRQYDPSQLPAFSPLYNLARTGLEDQYGVAKENILSSLPRGGAMGRALANLETGRAKDVGSLQSQISAPIISNLYNKYYDTAMTTAPNQAMTGMGTAAGLTNTRDISQGQMTMQAQQMAAAAAAQQEAASRQSSGLKGAGVGSMLGKGLGSIMGPVGSSIGGVLGGMAGNGLQGLFGGSSGGISPGSFDTSLMMM